MVTSLVKKGIGAFVSRQTNIFTAASFIILTTVFSQILGILKYRLLVSLFGASSDLGVFFAAFRIPDFVFQVVVAGALSASFIPIFTEFLANNKKKEAYEFTSALITIGIIFFIFISAIIIVFSYQLSGMIAPGFSKNELRLMANLMIIIQLSQVFFNIMDNAVKYNSENGDIKLELTKEQNKAVVKIIDTGVGIDKEDLKTIFDRFYRSDSNKNIKGHGLGLAIANSIIKAHNGKIEVLSTKAIGTTFIVTLPISS